MMTAFHGSFMHIEPQLFSWGCTRMTDFQDVARDRLRSWIVSNCARLQLTPSAVAGKLKIAKTTLTNFVNQKDSKRILNGLTIAKLEAFFQSRAPTMSDTPMEASPHDEPGLEPIDFSTAIDGVPDLLKPWLSSSNSISAWRLGSDALVDFGMRQGDIVIVDQAVKPEPHGSLVVADVFDIDSGRRRLLVRIYDEIGIGVLSAATRDPNLRRPMMVDGKSAKIFGVVKWTIRNWAQPSADRKSN